MPDFSSHMSTQDSAPGISSATCTAIASPDLEQVLQLVREISGELALEPLLTRIVERACRLIGADDGVIGLYDAQRDLIRTAASHGIPDEELRLELPRGHGLTGRVLELDGPVRCHYDELPHPVRPAPPGMHGIGMPIRKQGRLIGVFGISAFAPKVFDETSEELLRLFAEHAAVAIDNARKHAEQQRCTATFALIARVTGIEAAAHDLDIMLQEVADAIHETLDYQNVDIPLIEPDDPDTLVIRIRGGTYKQLIGHEDRLPIRQGIMGAAVREQKPQLVNDVSADPRYILPPNVCRPLAELAIPIMRGDKVLGVLNVEGNRSFDELDCLSLEIVAEHIGVAIANARLAEGSKRLALLEERQRLARDLHDNVTQILSSISLISQSLAESWRRDRAEGERRVFRLEELSRLALLEMRNLLQELSPVSARIIPSVPPQTDNVPFADRLRCLVAKMVPTGVRLSIELDGLQCRDQAHEEALLRICQEAVSNAVRHGRSSTIEIRGVLTSSGVRLTVSDDGCGIPDDILPGRGLQNMHARTIELGGQFHVGPRHPHGTKIQVLLPSAER